MSERANAALDAFDDAITFFHNQIDIRTADENSVITMPREYFESGRGWTTETVERAQLGWAPADEYALVDHLRENGHDDDAIRGTGLVTENLRDLWHGRYVFPYFGETGSRSMRSVGTRATTPTGSRGKSTPRR